MISSRDPQLEQMPEHLERLINGAEAAFASFSSMQWHESRGEGKWTRLQVLGHLIDSASNNHQRFVRAMIEPRLEWPGYDQVKHVGVQSYADEQPGVCLALWAAYNLHLSHVIRQIRPEKAGTLCAIDGAPEMTLSELVLDYVAHLEHHLRQLLEGKEVRYSGMPWPPVGANRQWPV